MHFAFLLFCAAVLTQAPPASGFDPALFEPPVALRGDFGPYPSLLRFEDGRPVRSASDWSARRTEIRTAWEGEIGQWPPLIPRPAMEILASTNRDALLQQRVRIEIAPGQTGEGYLLIPSGRGPFPAVVVPYYEPESSVGLGNAKLRDFALQLARRGFVALAIGSPGGDARKPDRGQAACQPLHFLGYVAANCYNALAALPKVDARRVGIVGHSYGGKWALFAAAFHERFACGAWSDPGIMFDEARPNVNYWEPWYLGLDPARIRRPGILTEENPRTGAYQRLVARGRDLHEVLALMAPRPFLVSGGAEDPPSRWRALNRVNEVYQLLGATNRIALSNRPMHDPTPKSNEQIYSFFEHFLGAAQTEGPARGPGTH
jgi:hypothetical protein